MQLSRFVSFLVLASLSPLAQAGVEMDLVTRNATGEETDRAKIYAQSKMIRMDQGGGNSDASMIFLGDRFIYVDHRKKSYIVMDEAMLNEVSAKISDAMKEMEAQLANMPPEQRAMVEQMMKGRMKGMMGEQDAASPKPRVESIGSSKWRSYSCERYAVFTGSQKNQEVCAAKLDDVAGSDEVIEAFIGMAAYIKKMTDSMPMMPKDGLNPGELMEQFDGFPVHTIDYVGGKVLRETSLDAVSEKALDKDMFSAPPGYRREDPLGPR